MPRTFITGKKIGVQIRIKAAMSMIIPKTKSIKLIINKIRITLSEIPSSKSTVLVGTR